MDWNHQLGKHLWQKGSESDIRSTLVNMSSATIDLEEEANFILQLKGISIPSSSSSLYIWNQWSIVIWYIGLPGSEKVPNIYIYRELEEMV